MDFPGGNPRDVEGHRHPQRQQKSDQEGRWPPPGWTSRRSSASLEQDDVDALRQGVRVLAQAVMETEVSTQIGAGPYERSTERIAYRNGSSLSPSTTVTMT